MDPSSEDLLRITAGALVAPLGSLVSFEGGFFFLTFLFAGCASGTSLSCFSSALWQARSREGDEQPKKELCSYMDIPHDLAVVGDKETDGERAQRLAIAVMKVLKDHLEAGPHAPARVYEVLNALAVNVAVITVGTGDSVHSGELFLRSLNANLELIYKAEEQDPRK